LHETFTAPTYCVFLVKRTQYGGVVSKTKHFPNSMKMQKFRIKIRRITPASLVMDTLREQRRVQAQWRLLAGKAWIDGDYVFTNQLGEHLKRQTIYAQYKKVMADIGLPDMRFHDLRHPYVKLKPKKEQEVYALKSSLNL